MGQKVNPHGIRVGVIKDWDSKWYAEADFADNLVEDYNIRTFLKKKLYTAGKPYFLPSCDEVHHVQNHEGWRRRHQDKRIRPSGRSRYGSY